MMHNDSGSSFLIVIRTAPFTDKYSSLTRSSHTAKPESIVNVSRVYPSLHTPAGVGVEMGDVGATVEGAIVEGGATVVEFNEGVAVVGVNVVGITV